MALNPNIYFQALAQRPRYPMTSALGNFQQNLASGLERQATEKLLAQRAQQQAVQEQREQAKFAMLIDEAMRQRQQEAANAARMGAQNNAIRFAVEQASQPQDFPGMNQRDIFNQSYLSELPSGADPTVGKYSDFFPQAASGGPEVRTVGNSLATIGPDGNITWHSAPREAEQDFDPRTKLSGETLLSFLAANGDKRAQDALANLQKQAAEKGAAKTKAKTTAGKKQVNTILSELENRYNELNEVGGIVSTDRSVSENLAASAKASRPGQFVGKITGDEEQAIRNKIMQTRPLLMNAIRQASEQGARGLDSEKELQFYLQAATDPTIDIDSNLNALRVLDQAYGLSSMGQEEQPQEEATTDGWAIEGTEDQ